MHSAQGFYLQKDIIEFLKKQNEDLKAQNQEKDELIKGLMSDQKEQPPGRLKRVYSRNSDVAVNSYKASLRSFKKQETEQDKQQQQYVPVRMSSQLFNA